MRIIEPAADLLRPNGLGQGLEALRFIEWIARISHRSEDKQTLDSWRRFLETVVMQHGDWSVVEHSSAKTIFRVDRGITHELVRHRLFAFTQESTRFVNGRKSYPNGLEFVYPIALPKDPSKESGWAAQMFAAEGYYFEMLDAKVRPQEARSVLPNALASTIAVTGNFRNWRHFFIMRTSAETHPDFKRVTIPLLEIFKQRIPLLFDDVTPEQKQSVAMSKPR